ncbi:MAG: sigma-70 family RNA polymerase sigma factor [Gemmatimonadota bacterium]|nr:sigma-70 family RNA polymerase sigma factor [Gemmatimonadota bacterium]
MIDPVGPDDASLVEAFQTGDESAAGVLVRRYSPGMARYVYGLGAPPSDVDDILQEAFFRAFKAIHTFRGDSSFRGWLFRIAANAARDLHRRGRRRGVVLSIDDHEIPDVADPSGEAEASEAEDALNGALGLLPPKQRDVFLLRAQQGLPYDEIAVTLGTTPGAARVHYHHAVKRLKEAMTR